MGDLPIYITRNTDFRKPQKQEDRLAKKLDGKKQKGSGSSKFNKGDVRMPEMLVEAKQTGKKSFSITLRHLSKITKEAQQYDLIPALAIEFNREPADSDEDKRMRAVERDWVLVPAPFLRELLDVYRERADED